MGFAQSKLVPLAFWVAFVALGLVTSLGSPQKPQARPKATRHSLVLPAPPGHAEIALRGGSSGRASGGGENAAVRED